MYTNKANALQLLALMKAHDINQVVLCPGSRNSPLVHSFVADGSFVCHSVVDERSAGFYALGIIMHTQRPVAVCCTSGSAVLNLTPAVAEACYQELPLLVITADRPTAWIGQMDDQTLPQPGAYGPLAGKAVQLPEINTSEEGWYCNRLINEALLELAHHGAKPVQINIPLSEPLFEYTVDSLPTARVIERATPLPAFSPDLFDGLDDCNRIMIVAGQLPPCSKAAQQLEELATREQCVILGEHLSNVHSPLLIGNADPILYTLTPEERKELLPDLVITVGGHLVSKRIKQLLRNNPPKHHWHISPSGEVADLFRSVTRIIETSPEHALAGLNRLLAKDDEQRTAYIRQWHTRSRAVPSPHPAYSDLSSTGALLGNLPAGASLHLANSSSVRLAQLYPLHQQNISAFCNRGTSGIEGCVSAAVGYARASKLPTFLLIGDLAFFYDMNGLWNPQLSPNLHILLNTNGGGEIFHALPGLNKSEALSHIAAPHRATARAWAESCDFAYLSASNEKELAEAMPAFIAGHPDRPVFLEVFSSMETNADILRTYYHQLNTSKP